jgi:hypothetical protein
MTRQQLNVLRLIFVECKAPTHNECEFLGKEVALNKKVIQTWFQNNRAKEKKYLAMNKSTVSENKPPYMLQPFMTTMDDLTSFEFADDECLVCGVTYNESSTAGAEGADFHGECGPKRGHLFSEQHVARLTEFVDSVSRSNGHPDEDHENENSSNSANDAND